jgi:hypothetical protein
MSPEHMPGWLVTLSNWDTAITLPLTIVGFALTLIQVSRAKSKAEAARKAAVDARDQMSQNYLLVLLPQLHRTEDDLDSAIRDGEARLVLHHMSVWRWQAGQVRQMLEADPDGNKKSIRALTKSIALAARTKNDVMAAQKDQLLEITRAVSESIATATSEVGALAVIYSREGVAEKK